MRIPRFAKLLVAFLLGVMLVQLLNACATSKQQGKPDWRSLLSIMAIWSSCKGFQTSLNKPTQAFNWGGLSWNKTCCANDQHRRCQPGWAIWCPDNRVLWNADLGEARLVKTIRYTRKLRRKWSEKTHQRRSFQQRQTLCCAVLWGKFHAVLPKRLVSKSRD